MLLLDAATTSADPLRDALASLASHGPIGILALIAIYVAYYKDKQLGQERAARLADSEARNQQQLALIRESYTYIDKLAAVSDAMANKK